LLLTRLAIRPVWNWRHQERKTKSSSCLTHQGYFSKAHYGRRKIPQVSRTSRSVKNRALGEVNLPQVLHSGKRCFPEFRRVLDTRGRETLGKVPLPRVQHSGKSGTRKRKLVFDSPRNRSRLKKIFSECPASALGEGSLFPERPDLALKELIFLVFPHFLIALPHCLKLFTHDI
jgi:hypothetical protein